MTSSSAIRHSAGGVVFRQTPAGEHEVVLILTKGVVWGLPKGPARAHESLRAAAMRAVRAETGIRVLAGPHIEQSEYSFWTEHEGQKLRVQKRADYFLMHVLTEAIGPLAWTIDAVTWLPIEQAIDRLSYKAEREVLTRARSLLRAPGGPARLLPPLMAHLLGDLPAPTLAALAQTEAWADAQPYAIVGVPSEERADFVRRLGRRPQLVAIDDGDEFTVVLPEPDLDALPDPVSGRYRLERGYRFVRLEAELPWDTVGYGAAVFAALAAAGISAGFYSGYSIDYLLVKATDLAAALAALRVLIAEAGRVA